MDIDISIRLTHFLVLKKRVLFSIQFNEQIIKMMLPTIPVTKFV